MKTATQWVEEYNRDRIKSHRRLKHSTGEYVRQIQIDALEFAASLAPEEKHIGATDWRLFVGRIQSEIQKLKAHGQAN